MLVLTAVECVLLLSSRLVRNLYARPPLVRILEEIDVGSFVESVMRRNVCGRSVKVMNVPKKGCHIILSRSSSHVCDKLRKANEGKLLGTEMAQ